MTETTPPAEVCAALIAQSNSLIGQDKGLQQGLCLVAAGLFAVAAAIRDRSEK